MFIPQINVWKETSDNFSPSLEIRKSHMSKTGMLVRVSFHGNISGKQEEPCYRVSVWGLDDTGYDKDFKNEVDAYLFFLETIKAEDVTKNLILKMGYKPF